MKLKNNLILYNIAKCQGTSPPTNGFLMSPSDSIRDMLDIDVSAELAILFGGKQKLHKIPNELPLTGPDSTEILRSVKNDVYVDITPCVNPNLVTPAIRPKSPISLNSRRRKNIRNSSPFRSPEQMESHLSFSPKHIKVGQVKKIKSTNAQINIDTTTMKNGLSSIFKDNERKTVPESKIHVPNSNVVKLAPGIGGLRLVNKLVYEILNSRTSKQQHEQEQQQNHPYPQQQEKHHLQQQNHHTKQQQEKHHLQQQEQNHHTKPQQQQQVKPQPLQQQQQQKQHQQHQQQQQHERQQETCLKVEKEQQLQPNHNFTATKNIVITQIRIPSSSSSSQQQNPNNSNAINSANNKTEIISCKNEISQKFLGRNILGQIENNSKPNSINIDINSNGQANGYREVKNSNHSNNAESLLKLMNVNSSPKTTDQITKWYYPKPRYTYACLITMALKNSITGTLHVTQIYNFIKQHFPYFRMATTSWRNSVRHTLCSRRCFVKIEKPGCSKDFLWKLNPFSISELDKDIQKFSKNFKINIEMAMEFPEHLEALKNGEMKHSIIESDDENFLVDFGEDDNNLQLGSDDGNILQLDLDDSNNLELETDELLIDGSEPNSVEEEQDVFEPFFTFSESSN